VVIYNNSSLGLIKLEAESVGLVPFRRAIEFPNPDFAALARACGGHGFLARKTRADPLKANDAVQHLRHHGIDAVKYRSVGEEDDTADILVAECRSLGANLLVMGSYGHSGLHELLPGSTTTRILRIAPFPLLIAH
jgi:nucleotide-binding universal stress UspA family protein